MQEKTESYGPFLWELRGAGLISKSSNSYQALVMLKKLDGVLWTLLSGSVFFERHWPPNH